MSVFWEENKKGTMNMLKVIVGGPVVKYYVIDLSIRKCT